MALAFSRQSPPYLLSTEFIAKANTLHRYPLNWLVSLSLNQFEVNCTVVFIDVSGGQCESCGCIIQKEQLMPRRKGFHLCCIAGRTTLYIHGPFCWEDMMQFNEFRFLRKCQDIPAKRMKDDADSKGLMWGWRTVHNSDWSHWSEKKAFSPCLSGLSAAIRCDPIQFQTHCFVLPLHKSDPGDTQDVMLKSGIGDIIWNLCRRGQEGEQSSAVNQFTLFLFFLHQIADYNWTEFQCVSVW